MKILNPLRYPGSKASFAKEVEAFFNVCGYKEMDVIEPFAGSAAVSIHLVSLGLCKKATIIERDPLLYAFWKVVFSNHEKLCSAIDDLKINLDTWHSLQPLLEIGKPSKENLVELAVGGLFFNRTNFSGVLNAGPIGGLKQKSEYKIDCRFNKKELIERISNLARFKNKFRVLFGDGISFIESFEPKRESIFFYIDPPYFVQGERLYRFFFTLKEHKQLSAAIKTLKVPWLLSYDKHPVIEMFYEKYVLSSFEFNYSSKKRKIERECLVTNIKIPKASKPNGTPKKPAQIFKHPEKRRPSDVSDFDLFGISANLKSVTK